MADAPWFALAVDYWRNPKVARAGFLAGSLNLAALAYCAEQLTDGFVPYSVIGILAAPMQHYVYDPPTRTQGALCGPGPTPSDPLALASDLVDVGLWLEVDGGWQINDYLKHQRSRVEVEEKREQARNAGKLGGLKRVANRAAKQTASDPLSDQSSGTPSGTPSGSQAHTPTHTHNQQTSSVGADKPPATRSRKKPATRAPDIFPITPAMAEWGRAKAPLVSNAARETEAFLNHHRSKANEFVDWTAAWRTWMSNAQKYAEKDGRGTPQAIARAERPLTPDNEWKREWL